MLIESTPGSQDQPKVVEKSSKDSKAMQGCRVIGSETNKDETCMGRAWVESYFGIGGALSYLAST